MLCIRVQTVNSFDSAAPRRSAPRSLPSRPRPAVAATKASLPSKPNRAGSQSTEKRAMPTAAHHLQSHSGLRFGRRAARDSHLSRRETGCNPRQETPAGSVERDEEYSSILAAVSPPASALERQQTAGMSPMRLKQ